MSRLAILTAISFSVTTPFAGAHPVPKDNHDRAIIVRLTPEALVIEYRLELDRDGLTLARDLREAIADRAEWAKLTSEGKLYEAFPRTYAPLLAGNLTVKLDGQELLLDHGPPPKPVITDSILFPLTLRHAWKLQPGQRYQLTFHEGNYETDEGLIKVSVVGDGAVYILKRSEADEETKNRPYSQRRPGDEKRLRTASATFEVTGATPAVSAVPTAEPEATAHTHSLIGLLFNSEIGFFALLGMAAGFGAVHALTPGHGKTLVAAYLVGEQGTVWHAVLLGLVTTFTHTIVVILLAIWMQFVPTMAVLLGFVSGLIVAGLGFWLLLTRLAGGADHVHIGGSGHHHHHHQEPRPLPTGPRLTSWGLIVLGISGGIVPCYDAIALLGVTLAAGKPELGLPMVLAFSAGLAAVLVVIGILVVRLKNFAQSHWGESRWFRALPLVSAALILVMGLWLCYASLQPPAHHAPAVATHS